MKKLALTLSMALVSLVAANGYAQTQGGDDADEAKAAPTKAVTKEEKAAAKQARKAEARALAKTHPANAEAAPPAPEITKVSKPDRKAAAIKRRAEAAEAQKSGDIKHDDNR